jgi:hypothetical protein
MALPNIAKFKSLFFLLVKLCKTWTSKGEMKNLSQISCFFEKHCQFFGEKNFGGKCVHILSHKFLVFGAIFGSVFSSFNQLIDATACLA